MITAGTRQAAILLTIGVLISGRATACDPNQPPSGGTIRVSAATTPCADDNASCYRPFHIAVDGTGFQAGTRLKVFLPQSDQTSQFTGFVIGFPFQVKDDGAFHVETQLNKCFLVTHPRDLRSSLFVAADDLAGNRQAFAFVPTSTVICQPPFAELNRTDPCNPRLLCPRFTNDSATTVGLHWKAPTEHNGFYRMRYSVAGDEGHYTEHTFGGDVRDVAVNNLEPGTTYTFIMQSCTEAGTFGRDDCAPWVTVGAAAPG